MFTNKYINFTAQCISMPLGMESGEIPDSDITASSAFEHGNVGPHIGRFVVFSLFYEK
jgi:hypothetical protein